MKKNLPGQTHTEILNFFLSNPGYMKKGAAFLAMKLNCTIDQAWKARAEAHKLRNLATKELSALTSIPKEEVSGKSEIPAPQDPKEDQIYLPNILIVDIETAPIQAYVWRLWKQNVAINQIISEWFMLTWSAKWLGSPDVMSARLTSDEAKAEDDKRIVKSLWSLLDEADIVIAHNAAGFDVPKMKARFIINNLPPTSPYQVIDTLLVARKEFGFSSNKLDALATYFGYAKKMDTDFELWANCVEGNEEALTYMENYNRKDVVILEKVYLKLRPFIKSHPNITIYDDKMPARCPSCGHGPMVREHNYYYTTVNKYPVFRCHKCGAQSRSRKAEKRTSPVELVSLSGKS